MAHTYRGFQIKNLHLKNRIVMPPMCMYSSDETGKALDFHHVHYATRAIGGVGLIIQEATAVARNGRISARDLGIWDDAHVPGLAALVETLHGYGTRCGIQLGHAGRKSDAGEAVIVAPSAIRYNEFYQQPQVLSITEITSVVAAFRAAAGRAAAAGYDTIEIHGAHGYLIHQFLSPLTNQRGDEYGGSLANRTRLLRDVLNAVHQVWPADKPVMLRLSAVDYVAGGLDLAETIRIVQAVKDLVDVFHISSGGLLDVAPKVYPGYQLPFAEEIRRQCQVPVIAVGLITEFEQVEEILGNQRADLVALGRELLRNPYWPLLQSGKARSVEVPYPPQYERARR